MLKVPIDKILPVTDARANISKLVDDVERGDIFVLTRGGRPAVVLAPVEYIKKLHEQSSVKEPEHLPQEKEEEPNEPVVYNQPSEDLITSQEAGSPLVYQEPTSSPLPSEAEETAAVPTQSFEEEQKVPVKVASNY